MAMSNLEVNSFGCLLYGMPGTGKTCFTKKLAELLIKKYNAVCIKLFAEHTPSLKVIINLAKAQKENRLVVILLDEFDQMVDNYYKLNNFQELYDGYNKLNNVLYLMTTNHLDSIPDSLKERPSRIQIVEEVKYIPTEVCMALVKEIVPEKYKDKIDVFKLGYYIGENPVKIDQIKHIVLEILSTGCSETVAINKFCKLSLIQELD